MIKNSGFIIAKPGFLKAQNCRYNYGKIWHSSNKQLSHFGAAIYFWILLT